MKIKKILTFLAVCTLVTGAAAQVTGTYMQMINNADESCMQGRWEDAEKCLQTAMRLEPENPMNVMLLANIGMIRFYQGNNAGAISALDSAHNISPRTTSILENRAKVMLAMRRIDDALADYDKILNIDSLKTYSRYMRGLLRLQRNDTIGSRLDFEALDRIAPDSLETNIAWASYGSFTGNWPETERRLSRAIAKDPSPDFLVERARARIQTDNLQGASDDLGRAILHQPDNPNIYLMRAEINYLRYRYDDAAADARKALSLGAPPAAVEKYLKK